MPKLTHSLVVVGALAASVGLSACASTPNTAGSSTPSSSAPSSSADEAVGFNDQDVMFVQAMIPHHEQAVEMADVLLGKDGIDPRVVALAEEIKAAQAPEIATMKEWLAEWNADDSMSGMSHGDDETSDDEMSDDGMSGDGMSDDGMSDGASSDGMMSDDEMSNLQNTEGVEASRAFLTGMTAHHQGAIVMAKVEIDQGADAGAIALAQSIVDTQQTEIDTMTDILASL